MNWVAPIKDQETLLAFEEALKEKDYKYYIMFKIGVGTGLQLQDILLLKNKDVTGKSEISVSLGTKKVKTVYKIPDELKLIISDYTKGKNPDAYLILGFQSKDKPVSREQAYRVFRAVGHQVGLNSIGAQTMRKTFAYNYYKETGDIYYLQNMFNHASPSITYRFIGELPNVSLAFKKLTAKENERSRYFLYLNGSGKRRINEVINSLETIKKGFDEPSNNDAFYGRVDSLLDELELLMTNYKNSCDDDK